MVRESRRQWPWSGMEELAWRYTQGAEGFPPDAVRAISLLEKIADGYRQGHYGLPKNQQMASSRQKQAEDIKALEERAARGDPEALATIGRQLLGSQTTRTQGITQLEKAAARGDARIQYELGAIFLFGRHGIAQNLEMGRKWWDLALAQKHLKTMEYVALAYEKGGYSLAKDFQQAQFWDQELLQAYESGQYLGDIDDQFIAFQRRRLEYMGKALQYQADRSRRYEQASSSERQIMEIEDRYRLKYQKAVNGLNRFYYLLLQFSLNVWVGDFFDNT